MAGPARLFVAFALCLFGFAPLHPASAESARGDTPYRAQPATVEAEAPASQAALAANETSGPRTFKRGQKFVEFRGELNYFPGNTSLIYGTLGKDGNPIDYQYVSYEPAGGVFGLVIGSIIPFPSYFDGYSWDKSSEPATKYRVLLTEEKFRKLHAFIEESRRTKKVFWLYTENCARFVRDAARVVGLKAPEGTFVMPAVYINMLSFYNRGRIADSPQ